MQTTVTEVAFIEKGMRVNPKFSQVGCPLDGIVHNPVLELTNIKIKSQIVFENIDPSAKNNLSRDQWQLLCLTYEDLL